MTLALATIREIIASALEQEALTGELAQALQVRIPELRRQLVLPEQNAVAALMSFITSYIRSVPAGLRLVAAVSKRQGFYEYAAPFLQLAQDYFLQPSVAVPPASPLESLLDDAFLAHRLLEEVNDHHVRQLQRALLPVDMTEANIIVHHLLGDTFATELEVKVQLTANRLLSKEHIWDRVRAASTTGTTALLSSRRIAGAEPSVRLRLAS
ncbi:MAG: hypothetical protein Hals2KO_32890 [Halioglobus sp.]